MGTCVFISVFSSCSIGGMLAGCSVGGSSSVARENSRLRREVLDLKHAQAALEGERRELESKLRSVALEQGRSAEQAEALTMLPVTDRVEIDSLSGLLPRDRRSSGTSVMVALRPLDGRGRFVQVAGSVRIEVLACQAGAGREGARRIAAKELTAREVREAYRSGFTGTYYGVDVALDVPFEREGAAEELIIRVELTDLVSEKRHQAERVIREGQ